LFSALLNTPNPDHIIVQARKLQREGNGEKITKEQEKKDKEEYVN
jgi:hypothetical protein